ncbi:MAG TPA: proprotein convertase P-domain-containing protein [Thermoanaerobaculia bacterium]
MRHTAIRSFLVVSLAVGLASAAYAQRPTTSHSGAALPASPRPPVSPLVILYDQYNNASTLATGSQDFETAFDAFDDQGADDFVVPGGESWSIEGTDVQGVYFNGPGPAPSVNVTLFADSAGLPGGVLCDYLNLVPTDTSGSFSITFPSPCVLGPGAYWVAVQARMDFGSGGQWGWTDRTVQSNNPSVWRNPADGFGTGCTNFTTKTTCIPGAGGPDFVFRLFGSILPAGGVIPPAPPECGSTTVFLTNSTPVPIVDLGVVTSTIVVSGAGTYLWDLNLITNIRHTFNGDLDITLMSPAGTIVTLTTDNGGGADDVFNGTVWDDQANPGGQVPYTSNNGLVTDQVYANLVTASPLVPEEAFGAFVGEDPNGTWTLTISDDAGGDVGTLDSWSLQVTTLNSGPSISVSNDFFNSTPVPIVDLGVVTSTVPISGLGTRICSMNVTTDISHTFNADLDITLMSPAGTVVTLTTDNGGGNDNVFAGTVWDDKANPGGQVPYTSNDGLATDQVYVNGVTATPLVPEEALAAFYGENPTGTWTLTISDDAGGDVGTLNSWSIHVVTCSCAIAEPDVPLRVDEHAGSGSSSDLNGVFELGETVQVEPTWTNPGASPFDLHGFGLNFTGPAGPTYTLGDNSAAYGTMAPGATSNCFDSTGDCYGMGVTGSRPIQHWDATFNELAAPFALPSGGPTYTKPWTLHIGESFPDVPRGNLFYRFIENIFHNGVTGGCNATDYCPTNSTLRQQMAVFVLKSKEGSSYTPPACAGVFADVPCPSLFADWIEELFNRGVVAGCGGGNYCPTNPVLRQQMSVFLLKTLLGSSYVPPACTGIFADVPCPSLFADWIEDLFNRGIAAGCGGGNFCPTNPTTRGQMSPFLVKTFGLLLYGP